MCVCVHRENTTHTLNNAEETTKEEIQNPLGARARARADIAQNSSKTKVNGREKGEAACVRGPCALADNLIKKNKHR